MFKSTFDKNVEAATSHLILEPDWPVILQICDQINQKDVNPKTAFAAVKKKMVSPNPHSAFYALLVLESIVKNCGTPIHEEVFTKENCEMFSTFLEQTPHDNVRQKLLELVQTWAHGFRSSEKYQAIKDIMTILKTKGHAFPELKEADAMFTTNIAPNWADGKVCHRCRAEFSLTNRKHHCRNCGQVFCGTCTAKSCPLPKFGMEKDVRVCDGCYASLQRPTKPPVRAVDSDLPAEYLNSSLMHQKQTPPRKTKQELDEEEEFNIALALSQSEAEHKMMQQQQQQQQSYSAYRLQQRSPSPEAPPAPKNYHQEEVNPDLEKYLNRNYWEQRKINESPLASPSAPSPMQTPQPQQTGLHEKHTDELKIDEFAANMRSQIEIFVNRMKSNSSRGRSITTDSSVQTLFMTLTTQRSQKLSYIKELDDKRMWYEQLQDKLTQITDSRAVLELLRQEHIEKMRLLAEEQERQRQQQMQQKLEIMRKKKHEYLQYQRHLALKHLADQDREMQLRQEQQAVQYRMGQTAFPFSAGGGATVAHGSPSHQMNNVYNPYSYNPNSPGPMSSGQFNAPGAPMLSSVPPGGLPGAPAGPGALAGMYSGGMQPTLQPNHNQHPGMLLQGQLPPGMIALPNGQIVPNTQQVTEVAMQSSHANALQQVGSTSIPQHQQHQQQHQQQQQQQQQPVPPQQQQTNTAQQQSTAIPSVPPHMQQPPQLGHVVLQHQNVVHAQPPIPTGVPMPPPPVVQNNLAVVGGGVQPQPSNQPVANAQMQALAAAPAPPQAEPEPAAPEEPATAELISFD